MDQKYWLIYGVSPLSSACLLLVSKVSALLATSSRWRQDIQNYSDLPVDSCLSHDVLLIPGMSAVS